MENQKNLRPLKAQLKKACLELSVLIQEKYYIIDDGQSDEAKTRFYDEKLEVLNVLSRAFNLTRPASEHGVLPEYLMENYGNVIHAIAILKEIKIGNRKPVQFNFL